MVMKTKTEFELLLEKLNSDITPEQFFGNVTSFKEVDTMYRRLSKVVHPDHNPRSDQQASTAFSKLKKIYELARKRFDEGVYGTDKQLVKPLTITTKTFTYEIDRQEYTGDICNIYLVKNVVATMKIARTPRDNDLVANEAAILQHLRSDDQYAALYPFIQKCLDTFIYSENSVNRRANILTSWLGKWYTLQQVHTRYSNGLDPKDMAWMFRRILFALGFVHRLGVTHNALYSTNIIIDPYNHGVGIIDWCYATKEGGELKVINQLYRIWYSKSLLEKTSTPTPSLDIYMACQNMIFLLGGNYNEESIRPIRNFFRGCTEINEAGRPNDAWELLAEFDELIEKMWGERKFHPFSMD